MDAQCGGCVRDSFLVAGVGLLNLELLEFFQGFVEHYVAVEHVINDSLEAGAYLHRSSVLTNRKSMKLRRGVRSPIEAVAYLRRPGSSELLAGNPLVRFQVASGGGSGNLRRQLGARRLLVPLDAFEVVANVLLIKRRL